MALGRTLIQIRERSFFDLLDLSLVVVRCRPLALGAAALLGCAPFAALNAWLLEGREVPAFGFILLLILEAPWATAPLTVVLGGMMFGERPSMGRTLRTLLRGVIPLLIYQGLLRALVVLSVVLIPLIPTRLAFLDEVILLERGRWRSALSRAAALCGDRGGDLFARALAQAAFGALFVLAFWWAAGVLSILLLGTSTWSELDWPGLYDWRTQIGIWLAVAHHGVVRFLTYIDQRIRLEGWEVSLRLRQVGATLEEAERW